jgi:hypothetical protein
MSENCVFGQTRKGAKTKLSGLLLFSMAITACDDTGGFNLGDAFSSKPETQESQTQEGPEGEFIEKDVEAPDVFSVSEAGLWDGRPSLGGVWVAHPDVKEPERVMIRNQSNGQFVVGALFRRERENPGPRLQLSSDAANALDVLAGSPVELSVVALRKERIPVAPPEPAEVSASNDPDADGAPAAPAEIEETTLDPIAAASAAIDAAEPQPAISTAAPETPAIQSTLPLSRLDKPYIQVGIYNFEENAESVATQMRSAGMVPTVRSSGGGGKNSWRVIVGPATDASERTTLLNKIRAEGYSDAYPVTN